MNNRGLDGLLLLNKPPWYVRVPLKAVVLGLTILFVCFPYPRLLATHLERWRDPDQLIEADAPALRPFIDELAPRLSQVESGKQALQIVEQFVYGKLPYAWDWDNWGMADYIPTVTEAIERGVEDCDGRAVVAASLLDHFGYQPQIVTDFTHVWVKTNKGETMAPRETKVIVSTEKGNQINWAAWGEIPRALGYGVAVFPFVREAIILLVAWIVLLPRGTTLGGALLGLEHFVAGWIILRIAGEDHLNPRVTAQLAGIALIAIGIILLRILPRKKAPMPVAAD